MNLQSTNFSDKSRQLASKVALSGKIFDKEFVFSGVNVDFTENYFWHINFAYFTGKGYRALKLEDHHYFSENSQFGQGMRQVKGGSIRAFQENLNQLIQLVKVHMMPLLKEVKQAHEIKRWFDRITKNDQLLFDELAKSSPNQEFILKYRGERNEAINHLKDRWVMEVDQGKIWQLSKSAAEGGLDYVLLPQLFFGTALDDPFQRKKTLKEQLDEDIYKVDVTQDLLVKLGNFQYRFYTWLPTAIKDTEVTFKIKIATLKQLYTQFQMQVKFMKPLLVEIARKTEGLSSSDFYRDFELENPEFVNMFDYSYSYIRLVCPRNFDIRGPHKLSDLEFGRFGFFIDKEDLKFGKHAGKKGIIYDLEKHEASIPSTAFEGKSNNFILNEYKMKVFDGSREEANNISKADFDKLPTVSVFNSDLKKYHILEYEFSQRRKNKIEQTQQGPQMVPYMSNKIDYSAYTWSIMELASYREQLKLDDVKLLDTFIEELGSVRDELLFYANYSEDFDENIEREEVKFYTGKKTDEVKSSNTSNSNTNESKPFEFFTLPFEGLYSIIKPMVGIGSVSSSSSSPKPVSNSDISAATPDNSDDHEIVRRGTVEDAWKIYVVHKKANRFMQY